MGKEKIIILGAGLAGLSASFHLKRRGIQSMVFEKEAEAGGLCRSKRVGGFSFDYTGHLLHFRTGYGFGLVRGLLGDAIAAHRRRAAVFSHRRLVPYPFQCNLSALPPRILRECFTGFVRARGLPQPAECADFLSWIRARFGDGIARHFMIPYNTKFWTIPPEELTCGWLDGFVPVPTMSQMIDGTVGPAAESFGYNARFWYPVSGGISRLPAALAARAGSVVTGARVSSIDLRARTLIAGGKRVGFDILISSLPLPELSRILAPVPAGVRKAFARLRWNSILAINLGVAGRRQQNHWTYFPEKAYPFFRVGCYHAISPSLVPDGCGSFYAEVACPAGLRPDTRALLAAVKSGLRRCGMLRRGERPLVEDCNLLRYGYPVYDHSYAAAVAAITAYCADNRVFTVGRYGSWRYMSMEDALLDGKEAARRVMGGREG